MGTGSAPPAVDFWWLKPRADATALEEQTLNRHGKGNHKNDPGASKKVYAPIAALFSKAGASTDGKLRFGVATPPPTLLGGSNGTSNGNGNGSGVRPRAYIDCVVSGVRYYVCWVWQEDWSSPVSLGKKWMKGKVVYQREGATGRFFARPFRFIDGQGLLLPSGEQLEQSLEGVMARNDQIKLGSLA